MFRIFRPTLEWIQRDYRSYPLRFCVELTAWATSIGCSITMSITVPHPPWLWLYPIWIAGCAMYAWASWSRRSFGMLVKMLVSRDRLILREDWRQLMREKVRSERMHRDQIRRAVKHYGEQYTWWDDNK